MLTFYYDQFASVYILMYYLTVQIGIKKIEVQASSSNI